MATQYTSAEWRTIRETLEPNRGKYGLPEREYGSVLLGSFNIRKLGSSRSRSPDTWEFLADVCRSFDLLAVQEVMDDLSGLRRLMSLLGPDFDLIVSDVTGRFPGESGLGERLGFIYRPSVVKRTEVATDITYDRTKVLNTIAERYAEFHGVMGPYADRWRAYYVDKTTRSKPRVNLPFFLTFIRQPFCVSFEIPGHPGTCPYRFMTINAHLNFGKTLLDRKVEFDALMDWIRGRAAMDHRAYYRNFLLMGDLNLNFDNPGEGPAGARSASQDVQRTLRRRRERELPVPRHPPLPDRAVQDQRPNGPDLRPDRLVQPRRPATHVRPERDDGH